MAKRTRSFFTIPELPGLLIPWYTRPDENTWRKIRQHIYQRDGGRCRYCGGVVELYACHIHHVIPLNEDGRGMGTNYPDNLKVACIPCHENRHPHMKMRR